MEAGRSSDTQHGPEGAPGKHKEDKKTRSSPLQQRQPVKTGESRKTGGGARGEAGKGASGANKGPGGRQVNGAPSSTPSPKDAKTQPQAKNGSGEGAPSFKPPPTNSKDGTARRKLEVGGSGKVEAKNSKLTGSQPLEDLLPSPESSFGGTGETPPAKKSRSVESEDSGDHDSDCSTSSIHNTQSEDRKNKNVDLNTILAAIPSRQELEGMLNKRLEGHAQRLELLLKGETERIHQEIVNLSTRIGGIEKEVSKLQEKFSSMEVKMGPMQSTIASLALQVLDLENRSRRSNIRIRGVPESIKQADLANTVTSIFNFYLNRAEEEYIEFDRLHRVPGRRSQGDRPRDILVKLHYHTTKEDIMQKARDKGPTTVEGAEVILLQDLAKKLLEMRRVVKPLLKLITSKQADYRWLFPFGVNIRFRGKFFALRLHSQLREVFSFLEAAPIEIPNWMDILTNA